jgi:hypothetical protein
VVGGGDDLLIPLAFQFGGSSRVLDMYMSNFLKGLHSSFICVGLRGIGSETSQLQ